MKWTRYSEKKYFWKSLLCVIKFVNISMAHCLFTLSPDSAAQNVYKRPKMK